MSSKNNNPEPENEKPLNEESGNSESKQEKGDSLALLNISERKLKRLQQPGNQSKDKAIAKTTTNVSWFKGLPKNQKLLAIAIIALLSLGALGAVDSLSGNKGTKFLSAIAETVGLKEKSANSFDSAITTNGLQLSKEYIYAGSRMLAVEDYGLTSSGATPTPTPPPGSNNSASFVQIDSTTQGNWLGVYGGQGYKLALDGTSLPNWAQITLTGQSDWTWAASTIDQRALKKAVNNGDRIAATWYAPNSFDTSFNFTDGQSHKIAFYCLDWDTGNARSQKLEVLDGVTNAILDTRNISAFGGGVYVVWQVSGNVKVRVTTLAFNSVVSGIFIDSSSTQSTPTPTPPAITNIWQGGTASNQFGYQILSNDDVINPNGENWWWIKSRVALTQDGDWAEFEFQPLYSPTLRGADNYTNYQCLAGQFYTHNGSENSSVQLSSGDKVKFELASNNQVKVYKNGTYVYTFQQLRIPAQALYIGWGQYYSLPGGSVQKRPDFGGAGIIAD